MTRAIITFVIVFVLTAVAAAARHVHNMPRAEFARLERAHLAASDYGEWRHGRALVDHTFAEVVRPNNDTLYSSSFIDLSESGPLILSLPEMGERYYSVQFLDPMTEVYAVISRQTHDGVGGVFEVVRQGSEFDPGEAYAHTIVAPSNRSWVLVRILVDDEDDLAAVHALQDQITLEPAVN